MKHAIIAAVVALSATPCVAQSYTPTIDVASAGLMAGVVRVQA